MAFHFEFGLTRTEQTGTLETSMKRILHALSSAALIALLTPAASAITFGPVRAQAGESIRLVTHSETTGGTIQRSTLGNSSSGTISITRDRDLIWTFRDPEPDGSKRGMVRVPLLTSTTRTNINGHKEDTTDQSPLTGKMFAMSKPLTGDWSFQLDGSVPLTRIQHEIDELKVYLKRDWYPKREVKLGDSWEFDPTWIKSVIHRDLAKAQTIATMRLRQIRHMKDRELAIIDISISSSGGDFRADGSQSSGTVELKGEVTVNLKTMLDEFLELKGTITTTVSPSATESTTVTLPIHLTATKSFVREIP